MHSLHLDDEVRELLGGAGMLMMANVVEATYSELLLEFLSTFRLKQHKLSVARSKSIQF